VIPRPESCKISEKYPVRDEAQRALIVHKLIKSGLEEQNSDAYELYARAYNEFYPSYRSFILTFNKEQIAGLDSVVMLYPKTIYAAYALGLLGSYYEKKVLLEQHSRSPKKEEMTTLYKAKALDYFKRLFRDYSTEDYPPIVEKSSIFSELRKE